ncbi:MAG: acyl-ACP--UDP-N-acetylglucosamine O-acyltransferase [Rickettsiales bacterium]|nr:acyl-ACP--UDP-N-acetylglucosamine O-acyltransferase [Rickettsiales bacterium]
MSNIHPTAVIDAQAEIASSAKIGPYCVIGPNVKIADDVTLHSHVAVDGHTQIGEGTTIFPFASIGHQPQDLKFHGEKSELIIGKRNTIREQVTMNPGTEGDNLLTQVGDDCLFMIGAHVAHDCMLGNRIVMANNATLAGHVHVGDNVIIGGLAAVHQFVRIGHNAIIGGLSGVEKDVIPYGSVMGERADLSGLNIIGLKRKNIERDAIHELRNAYRDLFNADDGTLNERIQKVRAQYSSEQVLQILDFLESDSSRSFCTPKQQMAGAA